jgi:hypothetical protein
MGLTGSAYLQKGKHVDNATVASLEKRDLEKLGL